MFVLADNFILKMLYGTTHSFHTIIVLLQLLHKLIDAGLHLLFVNGINLLHMTYLSEQAFYLFSEAFIVLLKKFHLRHNQLICKFLFHNARILSLCHLSTKTFAGL